MVHCSVPTVGRKLIFSLWPHPLPHIPTASKCFEVLTHLCNPTENAVLPSLYRKAADAQEDTAFWEGQYHIFRVHIPLFQLKHLGFNPPHETGSNWELQNFCSALQDGKELLSLGPYSAAKVSFPLLPMTASFVMYLLTLDLSEKEVENKHSEPMGWECVERKWKPSSLLAFYDAERGRSALLWAPRPAIPPSFQVCSILLFAELFAGCRTVCFFLQEAKPTFPCHGEKLWSNYQRTRVLLWTNWLLPSIPASHQSHTQHSQSC